MSDVLLRGISYCGKNFLLKDDILIWLAHVGEEPGLTDAHRALIGALIRDFRESTYEETEWMTDE